MLGGGCEEEENEGCRVSAKSASIYRVTVGRVALGTRIQADIHALLREASAKPPCCCVAVASACLPQKEIKRPSQHHSDMTFLTVGLLGPRPSCWDADIVSRTLVWSSEGYCPTESGPCHLEGRTRFSCCLLLDPQFLPLITVTDLMVKIMHSLRITGLAAHWQELQLQLGRIKTLFLLVKVLIPSDLNFLLGLSVYTEMN